MPKWAGKGHSSPSNIVVIEVRGDNLDQKDIKRIPKADHVFIPIVRKPKDKKDDEDSDEMEERTQVYLVHLQPKLKKLNIFTSKFYDEEDG